MRLDVSTSNINLHHSINTPEIPLSYFPLGMLFLTNKQKHKLKYLQSLFGPFSAKCTTRKMNKVEDNRGNQPHLE